MKLYYPHKPYIVTQSWGNLNSAYSTQFGDPTFTRHNGIDSIIGKYDYQGKLVTEFWVTCPVEGFKVGGVGYQANGAGNYLWLDSKEPILIGDKTCTARLYFFHGKKILVKTGDEPALGELMMISDSTGFSTGLHLHMGLYRIGNAGQKLDKGNEAEGSYDPSLFYTKEFAIDKAAISTLTKSTLRYLAYLLGK